MSFLSLSDCWKIQKPAVLSKTGVACSQNSIVSRVGIDVLKQGGNAIDAAIAMSFSLGVAEPWMSGIGGGGYMVIKLANEDKVKVVDFGMKTPLNLNLEDYPLSGEIGGDLFSWPKVKDDRNLKGAKSVAIPGIIAGMDLAHKNFGTLPWYNLVNPSVKIATQGVSLDWYYQLMLSGVAKDLVSCPIMKETFFDEFGFTKSSSWTAAKDICCTFDRLAKTLEKIAKEGADTFYRGDLAASIINDLQEQGGRHCVEDFSSYKAKIVNAKMFKYRGHSIFVTPELTAGLTLQRAFEILENNWLPTKEINSETYVAYNNAIRTANEERFINMGDCIKEPAPSCTTSFNVIDKDGNMVAVTQTLLSIFGAKIMLPNSGIIMNNGVMWFDPEAGKPNSLMPNKRCLSNMCPTLIHRSDNTFFALGAAGGRKIMPAVTQLASFLLDYNMDIEKAMYTPRLDMSNLDVTIVDELIHDEIYSQLSKKIENVIPAKRTVYPYSFACPSIASLSKGITSAITEYSSPWTESIAQDPIYNK